MRRILASVAVASVLLAGAGAWAQEDTAPVTVADTTSSETTTADSGGGALHAKGALFDKDDSSNRKTRLSFFAEFPWGRYYLVGFGIGLDARIAIPIVKGGFVPGWNDSFWIEFGLDTGYHFVPGFAFTFTIPAEAFWMVHLIKNLGVYAKLSVGVAFAALGYLGGGPFLPGNAYFYPFFHGTAGLGVFYNLSESFALRGEFNFGYDSNVKLVSRSASSDREQPMATQCDVLIIGAGPAGSVAGAMLAKKGKKVLCLEAQTFPRFVIGESLLPRCNDILEEAGLLEAVNAWGFMPKPAAKFLKGEATERFCFAEMFPGQRPAALQVTRADFDQLLATEARKAGSDIRYLQRVDAVEPQPDGQRQLTRATDLETGESYEVESRFVLDCSGYGRVLPRLFGLEKNATLSPKIAVFSHFEGDERPQGPEGGDIWVTVHPNGAWIWLIPFSTGRTSVGVVAEPHLIEPHGANDHDRLAAMIRTDPNAWKRLSKAVPVLKTARLQSWSAAVTKFWGPGWALTGNASEFLDPVFSSGVTLALESSHRAAKLVDRQLAGGAVDWDKDYTQVMDRAVGVFRVFVETWYTTELQRVMLFPKKADRIKRAITSVLGGYVLDEQNPFVRDARGTLEACLKLIA